MMRRNLNPPRSRRSDNASQLLRNRPVVMAELRSDRIRRSSTPARSKETCQLRCRPRNKRVAQRILVRMSGPHCRRGPSIAADPKREKHAREFASSAEFAAMYRALLVALSETDPQQRLRWAAIFRLGRSAAPMTREARRD
jgi:hypothetical protein